MIKVLFLICLFSFNAWSRVSLELVLNHPTVKQGEIAIGRLIVRQAEGQAVLAGLKGKNLGKTLYLLNVSPFMGKQGVLESSAKIIFFAVPATNAISDVVNGEDVFITWNNVEVLPTEVSKSFLLGDFNIPERKKILVWILVLACLTLIIGISFWFLAYFKKKRHAAYQLSKLKSELTNCTSYEDIVLMWRQKQEYLKAFPDLGNAFKNLEDTLFKYQFKSYRTDQEVGEVLSTYKKFKIEVSGVLNAI